MADAGSTPARGANGKSEFHFGQRRSPAGHQ